MESNNEQEVKFRLENVMVSPYGDNNTERGIYGYVSLIEEGRCLYLCWRKYGSGKRRPRDERTVHNTQCLADQSLTDSFVDVSTGETVNALFEAGEAQKKKEEEENAYNMKLPMEEIHSIKKYIPTLAIPYLIIKTKSGIAHTPLFFADGGIRRFFEHLQTDGNVEIYKAPQDPFLILINDFSNPLNRSKHFMNNEDLDKDKPYLKIANKATESLYNMGKSFISSFSNKVPKFGPFPSLMQGMVGSEQAPQDIAQNAHFVHYGIGSFEVVESGELKGNAQLPQTSRETMLTNEEWTAAFDPNGKILNTKLIKHRIFYGGVEPSIRKEVWKFLLNYYPWDSNTQQRQQILQTKEKEYRILQSQWKSISAEQESHFSQFRNRRAKVDKDVVRTERTEPQFKDINSPYLTMLREILITYFFFNWDVGYVQGMNDLVATILLIQDNEIDTFWCFKGLMDRIASNFHKDQTGMHVQLEKLKKLVAYLDPAFHEYLFRIDGLNMFFCYRWLLIIFRREFSTDHIRILWESFWTDYYHKDFPIFFALAILVKERNIIMDQKMKFDSILQHVTLLAENMNAQELLNLATALYLNFDITTDDEVKANIFEI